MLVTLSGGRAIRFDAGVGGALPEWTQVECALAARGVAEHHWEALRFTYAGIDTHRSMLKIRLLTWAERAAVPEQWPQRVVTLDGAAPYLEDLIEIHLIEERQPWRFRAREEMQPTIEMHAAVFNVTERTWQKTLRPIYGAIQAEWLRWQSIAASCMRRRLIERELEP